MVEKKLKLKDLNWQLIMDDYKEPENEEELYQVLFPKKINNEGLGDDAFSEALNENRVIQTKFESADNVIDLISYVGLKLAELEKKYFLLDIYSRVLYLCNINEMYEAGVKFTHSIDFNINRFLYGMRDNKHKEEFYSEYYNLVYNYYIAKLKSEGLENEDYEVIYDFILNANVNTWITPESIHLDMIELILNAAFQEGAVSEIYEKIILKLPYLFVTSTSIHYLRYDEEDIRDIYETFNGILETERYKNLHPALKESILFVKRGISSNDGQERINPKALIKRITKDLVEKYEPLIGTVIQTLLDNSNLEIETYLEVIKECDKTVYKTNLLEKYHFIHLNVRIVFYDLFEKGLYIDFYKFFNERISEEQREKAKRTLPFQCAFIFNHFGKKQIAKEIYQSMIDSDNSGSAVYNNLGVIYKEEEDLDKALELFEKGLELSPDHELLNRNKKNTELAIEELKKRPQKMKDIYFKKTDKLHKRIAFAIYKLEEESPITVDLLMSVTKITNNKYFFEKQLKMLIDWGIIIKKKGKGFALDPTIYNLVQNYIDPQLEREVVRSNENKLFRPIFYHESEINLYRVLNELFPQHFVFPNMDLKTIIDVSKIKTYLDSDVLDYMFKAHVDFAIIDTTTYFPIIAFEKDSEYQDKEPQKTNALKKNMIFEVSGLSLIRLRYNSAMDYERLKEEIKQATKQFLIEVKSQDQEDELLRHFDLDKFGIRIKLPTKEEIQHYWAEIVGDVIAEKTVDIEIDEDQGIVIFTLLEEIKPILQLSEKNIKSQLYQQVPELNTIKFTF